MTDSPTSRKVRPVFVYRVNIISYPEGSLEPGWRPACWSDQDLNSLLVPSRLRGLHGMRLRRALARTAFRWPRLAALAVTRGRLVPGLAAALLRGRNPGDPV